MIGTTYPSHRLSSRCSFIIWDIIAGKKDYDDLRSAFFEVFAATPHLEFGFFVF
jgi:hypothetical protein